MWLGIVGCQFSGTQQVLNRLCLEFLPQERAAQSDLGFILIWINADGCSQLRNSLLHIYPALA